MLHKPSCGARVVMSGTAAPISAERFALAIEDLPLANLHLKASELRNSVAHLLYSNEQLQSYADEGDRDCLDAIHENEQVLARLRERIALLRREVERRGFRWEDAEVEERHDKPGETTVINGGGQLGQVEAGANGAPERGVVNGGGRGGSLSDEELERRLREQMEQDEEDNGLHI